METIFLHKVKLYPMVLIIYIPHRFTVNNTASNVQWISIWNENKNNNNKNYSVSIDTIYSLKWGCWNEIVNLLKKESLFWIDELLYEYSFKGGRHRFNTIHVVSFSFGVISLFTWPKFINRHKWYTHKKKKTIYLR